MSLLTCKSRRDRQNHHRSGEQFRQHSHTDALPAHGCYNPCASWTVFEINGLSAERSLVMDRFASRGTIAARFNPHGFVVRSPSSEGRGFPRANEFAPRLPPPPAARGESVASHRDGRGASLFHPTAHG